MGEPGSGQAWGGVVLPPLPADCRSHVLDGATEGVGDSALMDRFFAEPKVGEFDVT